MELVDHSELFRDTEFGVFRKVLEAGGVIKGINAKGAASNYSRREIERLEEEAKKFKVKGLSWLKYENDNFSGSLARFLEGSGAALREKLGIENGDLFLIVADKLKHANLALGHLRNILGRELGLIDNSRFEFLWVKDWPAFEYDEEAGRYDSTHHPFTSLKEEDMDLLLSEPEKCHSKSYDLVLNGYELGSGSIRIHDQDLQRKVFAVLGLSEEEVLEKFGFLIEALKYGTPPHGGIALGLDRLAMILCGAQSLRDVIAFPKSASGIDPMCGAPRVTPLPNNCGN